jgi:hypothetical protein
MSMIPKTLKEAREIAAAFGGDGYVALYVKLCRHGDDEMSLSYSLDRAGDVFRVVSFQSDGGLRFSPDLMVVGGYEDDPSQPSPHEQARMSRVIEVVRQVLSGSVWSLHKSRAQARRWLLCHASGRRRVFVGGEVLYHDDTFAAFEARLAFAALARGDTHESA